MNHASAGYNLAGMDSHAAMNSCGGAQLAVVRLHSEESEEQIDQKESQTD